MLFRKIRKIQSGFSLSEILMAVVLTMFVGVNLLGALVVVKNSFFSSSAQIDLQQQARYGIARMVNEISQTASSKIEIYRCPDAGEVSSFYRFYI